MLLTRFFAAFLLIAASIASAVSASNDCPPSEAIPKCTCKTTDLGAETTCRDLHTIEDLKGVTEQLGAFPLRRLEIGYLNASTIPVDIFEGVVTDTMVLDHIEVADASFRTGRRHFQGLEDWLKMLEITQSFRNGQRPLVHLALDHLSRLEVVLLEDNHIPELGDDWFLSGPASLNKLLLERNGIETLGGKAFAALPNLDILAVAGNHINTISRSMLPASANKLRRLDLSSNKLSDLPADLFSGMPNLESVNLNHNLLRAIDAGVWSGVWTQLKTLRIQGAVVLCQDLSGPDLEVTLAGLRGHRLTKLELRRANATSLRGPFRGWFVEDLVLDRVHVEDDSLRHGRHLFRGLESALNSLEMRKMEISSLQLDHLVQLVVLILDDNSIHSVNDDWFTAGPTSLANIYLAKNGIADLDQRAFSTLAGLKHLDLSRNKIHILTRSMFPDEDSRLTALDLSRNRLPDLPDDLFSGMPFLREVDVSGNMLQTIRDEVWLPVFNRLKRMNVEDNPLDCGSLEWACDEDHAALSGTCTSRLREPIGGEQEIRDFCRPPSN